MQIEFKLIDAGGYKTPSKWIGVIKTSKSIETFEYEQGSAFRKIKKRVILRAGVKMPRGWRFGERVPSMVNMRSYDQRYILVNCTEPTIPDVDSFLACLVLDADCVRHGQSFEEFAAELGYDEDSRKAERIYNACRENWRKMLRLGLNLDELEEKYRDF